MRPPFLQRRVADYAIRSCIEEDALSDLQWVAAARLVGVGSVLLLCLCAALMVLLVGCNGATPTLYGKPIQDLAVSNGVKAVHIAEVSAATGVRVMTAGIASGVIKPNVGDVFMRDIDPKVKAALAGLKAILKTMETSPSETTTQKVIEATLLLQDVLNVLQAYLLDPTTFVTTQGATP